MNKFEISLLVSMCYFLGGIIYVPYMIKKTDVFNSPVYDDVSLQHKAFVVVIWFFIWIIYFLFEACVFVFYGSQIAVLRLDLNRKKIKQYVIMRKTYKKTKKIYENSKQPYMSFKEFKDMME